MSKNHAVQNTSVTTQQNQNNQQERHFLAPAVDVFENKENILIVADLPGVTKEDLAIQLNERELSIVGKRHARTQEESVNQGIRSHDFRRVFTLHQDLDADHIEAKLRHGVLTLTLPKAQTVKSREVAISAE